MKRTIAAMVATATLAAGLVGTANAAPLHHARISQRDKRLMRQANADCNDISDDSTWEMCVVGEYILLSHTYIDENYYKITNSGHIALTRKPVKP